jgi:hypothetical protein
MYYILRADNEEIVATTYHATYAQHIASVMGFECIVRYAEGFH